MKPDPSTCTFSRSVAFEASPASKPSSTFSQIVRPRMSPGRMMSALCTLAFLRASENPRAGTTAVVRVTRSLTATMKASPSRCTEPAKIWFLVGPTPGRPQDASRDAESTKAMGRAHLDFELNTARSPRPVIVCLGLSFSGKLPKSHGFDQRPGLHRSANKPQLLRHGLGPIETDVVGIVGCEHPVDHLAQQLGPAFRRIKAARNLARFEKELPVDRIGVRVWRMRIGKELDKRLMRHQPRLVIDADAETAHGKTPPKGLMRRGRIDGDGRPGRLEQLRQLAAPYEHDTFRHPELRGALANGRFKRRAPVFKRMCLEHQAMMWRRALGEAVDHEAYEVGLRSEIRERPEAGVMFKLQQHDVIGPPAGPDAPCRRPAFQHVPRASQQAENLKPELLGHALVPMRPVEGEGLVPEEDMPMVKRAMHHVHAQIAPPVRRQCRSVSRSGQRPLHLLEADMHEPGIAVRSVPLVGCPIGGQIAV